MLPEGVTKHDMPSGHTVYYRDRDHAYWQGVKPDGTCTRRVAGVSTISKNGDGDGNADGLMDWSARLTCDGIAAELAATNGASSDWTEWADWTASGDLIANRLRERKLTWRDLRDAKGALGTVSHDVLQSLAEGVMPPFQNGYDEGVISWWRTRRPDPVYVETVVFHHDENYAGRFDLAFNPDTLTLLDLKTSKYLRNAFGIQLNLYALAMRVAGYTPPEQLAILHVAEDGSWREVEVPLRPDWALDALRVHRNGQEIRTSLREASKQSEIKQLNVASHYYI